MRIGVYGGLFSPPHNGHVAAAKAFMEQMWLDVLYVVPTGIPPHKAPETAVTPMERLAMCERAFSHLEGVIISDMEIRRQGISYTADTLAEIRAGCTPDSRLFLLMGTDMLLTLDRWHAPEQIFQLCYPTYMRCEGADPVLDARIISQIELLRTKYGKVVRRIMGDPVPISSARLQRDLSEGKSIAAWVPADVNTYICDHKLYV